MHYESCKHKLSILQDTLNKYPGLKDKIVPYIWILRDPKTHKIIVEYVVAGRTMLEARYTGNLYFCVDRNVPNHERERYFVTGDINRLVRVISL